MTATTTAARGGKSDLPVRERPLDFVDVVMLLLAMFSVGLLLYVMFINEKHADATWVFVVDTSICGIFLVEFIWRWKQARWVRNYPFTHWYEVLGMIPIAHPALRGLRLLRVIVIVVRLTRLMYRVFGDKLANRLVDQLTEPLIDAIKRPIIVLVLDEAVKVVEAGNLPLGLAEALRENSDELEQLVVEKLNADPMTGRLKLLPFSNQIARTMIETTLRVVLDVLADPRVDEFVTDVVKENQARIREKILYDLEEDERESGEALRKRAQALSPR
jgi:voltage-gated potassium channel